MPTITPYSFKNVSMTADGIPITGFYSGDDAIVLTPNADLVDSIVGADGSGTFNMRADNSAKLALKLLFTSPSNDLFAAMHQSIRSGIFLPTLIYIKDVYGTALVSGLFAVKNFPSDFKYGEKDAGRTWTLEAVDAFVFSGRSGSPINQ